LEEINSRNHYRQSLEAGDQSMPYGGGGPENSHSQGFFQPLYIKEVSKVLISIKCAYENFL